MERWVGRVALVTGASAGIGASVARRLVAEGMKVVGAARRVERVQAMADELKDQPGKLIPIKCDLSKDDQVLSMFAQIKRDLGGVDVCINNAGINVYENSLFEGNPDNWRKILDVNVIALCLCAKEAVKSMRERGVDDGHIININSVYGHEIPVRFPQYHFYSATKHMVTALTEAMRLELRLNKTKIRISDICPGVVTTEFGVSSGIDPQVSDKLYKELPCLHTDDVTNSIVHVLSAPEHVQVFSVLIHPTESLYTLNENK